MSLIVCEDARGELPIGEIVSGDVKTHTLRTKGVAALPYDDQLHRAGCSAYVQRHWGEGWLYDGNVGERGCPIVFQTSPNCRFLYWAARVKRNRVDGPFSLKARLVTTNANQLGSLGKGVKQVVYCERAPELDDNGRAVIYGKVEFNTYQEGLLFLDLYAVASGVLIEWLAVTQHHADLLVT
jgi:hypothetical protein